MENGDAESSPNINIVHNSKINNVKSDTNKVKRRKNSNVSSASPSASSKMIGKEKKQQPPQVQATQNQPKGRRKTKELNKKGETKEGGEMDAFLPDKQSAASVQASSPPEEDEEVVLSSTSSSNVPPCTSASVVCEIPAAESIVEVIDDKKPEEDEEESKEVLEERRKVAEKNEENTAKNTAAAAAAAAAAAVVASVSVATSSEEKVIGGHSANNNNKEASTVLLTDLAEPQQNEKVAPSPAVVTLKYDYKEDQWSPLNPEGKKHYDRELLLQLQQQPMSQMRPAGLPNLEVIKDNMSKSRGYDRPPVGSNRSNRPGGSSYCDFTPNYVHPVSRPALRPRASQQGRKDQQQMQQQMQQQPMKKVLSLSLNQDVKLHESGNAWKPANRIVKDTDPQTEKTNQLYRQTRAMLNKLTPQNFNSLMTKINNFDIDTEERLSGVIDIVFEKAIDEPNFSVAYANMCRQLSGLHIVSKDGTKVNFKKLIILKCQKEFEKEKGGNREEKLKEIEAAETEEKKKELMDVLEEEERRSKRRQLGNIRFIGELFKLGMLTVQIMHECVDILFAASDEDSLECLCRLLTTIGRELEIKSQQAKQQQQQKVMDRRMDDYFQKMKSIIGSKATSSRIRFMLQDVVDLRTRNWVPRRDENNPKTIDQIHREAEKEELAKALNQQPIVVKRNVMNDDGYGGGGGNMGGSGGLGVRRGGGGGGGGSGPMMSGGGGVSGGGGGGSGGRRTGGGGGSGGASNEEGGGWNVVGGSKRVSSAFTTIDPNKLSIRKPQEIDENNIQFGPCSPWHSGSSGGGIGGGASGSASKVANQSLMSASQQEGVERNKFSALSSMEHPSSMDARKNPVRGHVVGSLNRDSSRGRGGSKQQQQMLPPSSRSSGPPSSPSSSSVGGKSSFLNNANNNATNREREQALSCVRNMSAATSLDGGSTHGQGMMSSNAPPRFRPSQPTALQPQYQSQPIGGIVSSSSTGNRSREGSASRKQSVDRKEQGVSPPPSSPSTDRGTEMVDHPQALLDRKCVEIVDEFLHGLDFNEAELSIKELYSPNTMPFFVNVTINHVLERSATARLHCGQLFNRLLCGTPPKLTELQLHKCMDEIFAKADDLVIDIPKFWEYIAELLVPSLENGGLPLDFLRVIGRPLVDGGGAAKLLAAVVNTCVSSVGKPKTRTLWTSSGLRLTDFLPENKDEQKFLNDHDLGFLQGDLKLSSSSFLPYPTMHNGLKNQLTAVKANNEALFDYVNAHVPDVQQRDPSFIRALVTAIAESAIKPCSKGDRNYELDVDRFKCLCTVIKRYVDNQEALEQESLYALQAVVHRLQHPIGLLQLFFHTLYTDEVISDEAFLQWKSNPRGLEGHAVAVNAVNPFLAFITSHDKDQEEDEDNA